MSNNIVTGTLKQGENDFYPKTSIELVAGAPTTENMSSWDAKYNKPSNGIPEADLSQSVISKLNDSDIFFVTYGSTAVVDIQSAVLEGKIPVCIYNNNKIYVYSKEDTTTIIFSSLNVANESYIRITKSSESWYAGGINLENTEYKTSTIIGNETDSTKYPTAKAVADYVQPISNKVTSLSNLSTDTQYPSAKAVYDAIGKYGVISQTQTWTKAADNGWDYVMSNQVTGTIPQANIDLFESVGAVFNEQTGYFELNGLTDISYTEMLDIYAHGNLTNAAKTVGTFLQGCNTRTNISTWSGTWNQKLTCSQLVYVVELEAFNYKAAGPTGSTYTNANCNWMFNGNYLKKIGELNMSDTTAANTMFGCPSLEEVSIKGLKINLSLESCSRLSAASVAYMIANAGTVNITITLHATAYARAIADSAVTTALASKTNVTLASA